MKRLDEGKAYLEVRRRAEIERRKATLKIGSRVRAVRWAPSALIADSRTVPPGTVGEVTGIDDAGTVFVNWVNGARLGITTEDDYEEVGDGPET